MLELVLELYLVLVLVQHLGRHAREERDTPEKT